MVSIRFRLGLYSVSIRSLLGLYVGGGGGEEEEEGGRRTRKQEGGGSTVKSNNPAVNGGEDCFLFFALPRKSPIN